MIHNIKKPVGGGGLPLTNLKKNNYFSKNFFANKLLIFFYFLIPNFLFAAGGLNNSKKIFETIKNYLDEISLVLFTIFIFWACYEGWIKQSGKQEVIKIIILGIVFGSAPWIAQMILGK